jgi:NADPH:quinone reductase-like Zn-dependent oxidoreductase/FtsP/CotA-like multicopper oxidase with cupredoxin domain
VTATNDKAVEKPAATFSTDAEGLQECVAPTVVDLAPGDTFDLRIAPVVKQIGNERVRMIAYNGSIPGPTLRVQQGSEISVRVHNDADTEATVHWHGLCLDNKYDGVPHETQDPIAIGGEFTYQVRFPHAGLYWYHPHIREDYGLDMGLYGNLVVQPADADYWPPVNREFVVTLDDVLLEDGQITAYKLDGPNFVAMGRFGNVMLTGGESTLKLSARAGEVVRFFFTNTANTRLFNVAIPGARMKLVGGDSGRYERHTFVEEVLLAPSERAIIDVLFETSGGFSLAHRTPTQSYILGAIKVTDDPIDESLLAHFEELRTCPDLTAERARIETYRERAPDNTLAFESLMPLLYGDPSATAESWTCPMHPDVVNTAQGTCPQCGMKLIPAAADAAPVADHAETHSHDTPDGLEWEDLMPDINRASDSCNMIWKLVDRDTGKANWEIDWAFTVGDQVKIRLVNDLDQDHPMHHPFHIHGAGRFLILCRDGEPDPNLVWKDTVLVRSNQTVDILLDVSNPGLWMAHCHIAEHSQSGMMFSFPVSEAAPSAGDDRRPFSATMRTPPLDRQTEATPATSGTDTMWAIVHDKYGNAPEDVLRRDEVSKPTIGDDEVLIRVRAASVDRGTWHIMAGRPYPIRVAGFGLRKPKYLNPGRSVAGTIESVGQNVTEYKPGDEVYGTCDGSFAEYAAGRPARLASKPPNLSFEQAAAVPVSGLAALQAVRDRAKVQAGQKVLIIGASGGVGTFAVQIAKAFGAEVTGVCSTAKADMVRALGADHVVDYTRDDFADGEHRYDAILDIGGNRGLSHLRRALARRGRLVIVGGETDGRWLGGIDRQLRAQLLSPVVSQKLGTFISSENAEDLTALRQLIESGQVTPAIDRTYPLSQVPAAIRYLIQGHARGKVVIAV